MCHFFSKQTESKDSYGKASLSCGLVEGLNNKIKTLKRQAYGFRDMEFFQLRVLFIHEAKAKVTGV